MLTYLTRRQQDAESPADFRFAGCNMMDLFVLLLWLLPAALLDISIWSDGINFPILLLVENILENIFNSDSIQLLVCLQWLGIQVL